MGTKVNSNYEDLLTFTRASKGHALRPVSYGDELVTNGDFSDGTTGFQGAFGATVSNVNGELSVTSPSSASGAILQTGIDVVVGKIYTFSISSTSATTTHKVRVGNSGSTSLEYLNSASSSTATTFSVTFVATTSKVYLYLRNSLAGTVTWDNVSVKEVIFDQPDGTLTLFEHPVNVPRVEWDSAGNRLGLLVEEARTNLVTYSEDFTDSYWTKNDTATLSLDSTGPDRQANSAVKLVDSGATGTSTSGVYVGRNVTVSTSTAYTFSVYAKKDQLAWVTLLGTAFTTPSVARCYFDLENGVIDTTQQAGIDEATMVDAGNGWYRCSITFTTDATDTSGTVRIYAAEGAGAFQLDLDGTSSILIYGAQFEAGSFPTSYIKTTGSTATRSADVASIPVADFGYNHDASTFIAEASELGGLNSNLQRHTLFSTETASALRLYVGKSGGGGGSGDEIYVGEGASNTYFELGDITQNTFYKVGVVVKTNDISASLNGGAIVSDSSVALAKDETTIGIGSRTYSGTNIFNGHIKSIKYYPRRLTNAQLQEITT